MIELPKRNSIGFKKIKNKIEPYKLYYKLTMSV